MRQKRVTTPTVLVIFKEKFPMYRDRVVSWIPNGKGSIRIKLDNGWWMLFDHHCDNSWSLQRLK